MSPAEAPGPGAHATERRSRLRGRAPWYMILTAALAARLAFVAMTPPAIAAVDGRYYVENARELLEHHRFGRVQRGPGYSVFIAGVFAIFGPDLVALRVVESVLGTIAVGLVGVIGARAFGRGAGMISAALAALHPVLAYLPSTQYSENLLMLVTTAALGAVLAAMRHGGPWRWAVSGVLLGLVLLVRPGSVLLLPGLAAGLALASRYERRRWLAPALVCGAAIALTIAPWIARNHRVYGQWFFIASGGGRQLWFGNHPNATADTRIPTVLDDRMEAELGPLPDELARERHLWRRALEWERRNPGRAAWLYVLELRNLFALAPAPATGSPAGLLGGAAQAAVSLVTFAGALLSLRQLRREPALWGLLGLTLSYALGSAFFFTAMRYRVAIEPALLWMAGSGWAATLGLGQKTDVLAPPRVGAAG
jgi:4-amino-4-deoxy-L-arabinose transferase-like glycosyltransferase